MAVHDNFNLTLHCAEMDLEASLFCGQSFLWQKHGEGVFIGVAGARAVRAMQAKVGAPLMLQNLNCTPFNTKDLAFWQHYFAIDMDYPTIQKQFSTNPRLAKCVQSAAGIRVLRQPFFDTLLCFIISQNNNIPRITGIVKRLCESFGTPLTDGLYSVPNAQTLAALSVEDLAPLRAGFRAKYLLACAKSVADGTVTEESLHALPNPAARALLTSLYGVGAKVADCILLFSLGRNDVAPMDVWMIRAMQELFPKGMPDAAKGYEGIAQQYIFVWARENLSPTQKPRATPQN